MPSQPKSFQQTVQELWELLKAYAQQETIGPLKNVGRQVGFGIAGSLLIAFGVLFLVLGVIRALDTQDLPGIGRWFAEHNYASSVLGAFLLFLACLAAFLKARGSGGAKDRPDTTRPETTRLQTSRVGEASQS